MLCHAVYVSHPFLEFFHLPNRESVPTKHWLPLPSPSRPPFSFLSRNVTSVGTSSEWSPVGFVLLFLVSLQSASTLGAALACPPFLRPNRLFLAPTGRSTVVAPMF